MEIKNLLGEQFGRLTVIEDFGSDNRGRKLWKCRCECGSITISRGNSLRRGESQSCGCLAKDNASKRFKIHGESRSKLYRIWGSMKDRCKNPRHKHYRDYGGRGISVCSEWQRDFSTFRNWAESNGYIEGLSIDRINVNGNYEPSNCRWITLGEQQRNKRNTHLVSYRGETYILADLSRKLNVSPGTVLRKYAQ